MTLTALVLVLAAAGPAAAGPAAAARVRPRTITSTDLALSPSGTVAYTWAATPALGCAADGLCGVSGALTVDVTSAALQIGRHQPVRLSLQTSGTARTQGPAPGTSCVDTLTSDGFGINLPLSPSQDPANLPAFGGPSAGRCAGPLVDDLARLPLPVRRHGHRVDLRASRTADFGPYQVTLSSTLTLAPAVSGLSGGSSSSISGGFFGGTIRGRRRVQETVEIVDAVIPSPDALQASFSAGPAPFCVGLGACGSSGTISLSLDPVARRLRVVAGEQVRHRLSDAAALADVRSGRSSATGALSLPATVTESVQTPGQPTCTATRPVTLQLSLFGPGAHGVIVQDDGGEAPRTPCPGPLESDLLPGQNSAGMIASAADSGAQLLARATTIELARSTGFATLAYHGRWSGHLTLGLTRRKLRVSAIAVRG